ncbi:DnaA/Hda family protein [Thalassoglobus sp. JC818]|uniref:DnaA/Hda family protein n=1 Tax=Thalassoglobus sp. JC818 TaxID=3232136 RepID=UPI00345A8FCB
MGSAIRQHDQHPFLVISENRLGVAAIKRLGPHTRRRNIQLVTLFGEPGTGKSRLARELIRSWDTKRADGKTIFVTASQYAAELAEASTDDAIRQFQRRYRHEVKLFVCEDIQSLAGRPESQRQLTAAIDQVISEGACVLFTSTLRPSQIPRFSRRLADRMRGGLSVTLKLPKESSRVKLIQHFLKSESITLSSEQISLIAKKYEVSAREILSLLEHIKALHRLKRPTDDWLAEIDKLAEHSEVELKQISAIVAKQFETTVADLKSPKRSQSIKTARQVAMFLAREHTELTLKEIGQYFGRGNHSTVIHACRKVSELIGTDPVLAHQVETANRAII